MTYWIKISQEGNTSYYIACNEGDPELFGEAVLDVCAKLDIVKTNPAPNLEIRTESELSTQEKQEILAQLHDSIKECDVRKAELALIITRLVGD